MLHPRYARAEMRQRGHTFYEQRLRAPVEPQHPGDFLLLEVETGDEAMDAEDVRAVQRAKATHPDGAFSMVRVGAPTASCLGAHPLTTT